MKSKISEEDLKLLEEKSAEHQRWLDSNQDATTEQYEARRKELESVIQPVVAKMYQNNSGGNQGGMPGSFNHSQEAAGQSYDDVD